MHNLIFKVIGEASSGEEAVEAAMEYLPDVMLMDFGDERYWRCGGDQKK